MLFSIIIPLYNAEKYLCECIESIYAQTYRDWEIVAIDDGSIDNTSFLFQQYAEKDSRLKLWKIENHGPGYARNLSIEKAVGDYIVFLDSDDYLVDNNALEMAAKAIAKERCKLLGMYITRSIDGKVSPIGLHRELKLETGKWVDFLSEQNCFFFTSYIYNRQFLLDNKLFFPDGRSMEDPLFLEQVMHAAQRYFVLPIEWYCYRMQNKRAFMEGQVAIDAYDNLLKMYRFAKMHGYTKIAEDCKKRCQFLQGRHIMKLIGENNMSVFDKFIKFCELAECGTDEEPHLSYVATAVREKIDNDISRFNTMIDQYNTIIIYGAGIVGQLVYEYIKLHDKKIFFSQTEVDLPVKVKGLEVFPIKELVVYKEDALVIIAITPNEYQPMKEVIEGLRYKNVYILDVDMLYSLSSKK